MEEKCGRRWKSERGVGYREGTLIPKRNECARKRPIPREVEHVRVRQRGKRRKKE